MKSRKAAVKLKRENHFKEIYNVRTEPELLPVNPDDFSPRANTQPGARMDISARGVWSAFERSFYDVRVTHPNCPSNAYNTLPQLYKQHEDEKKIAYGDRVLQPHR